MKPFPALKNTLISSVATVALALAGAGLANAQMSNDECLGCHGDASAGQVHVDPVQFGADAAGHVLLELQDIQRSRLQGRG